LLPILVLLYAISYEIEPSNVCNLFVVTNPLASIELDPKDISDDPFKLYLLLFNCAYGLISELSIVELRFPLFHPKYLETMYSGVPVSIR
jgi:hypothetical protein